MNDAHHTRSHAQWSASATARNTTCAGAIAMTTLAGEERESEAAAWGTAAHQLAQKVFASLNIVSTSRPTFVGQMQKTEHHEFVVDEEMVECAQEHVDYCLGRINKYLAIFDDAPPKEVERPRYWIERNFRSIGSIRPSRLAAPETSSPTSLYGR